MAYPYKLREEELKNKVAHDWFSAFDTTQIIGNIDFAVYPERGELFEQPALLWAEAKTGDYDLVSMFAQLILTIGKARTFDRRLPPAWLGAFDCQKMAFVRYIDVQDLFYLNDFNWHVAPSNHETKEFARIRERVCQSLEAQSYCFDYGQDAEGLHHFIKQHIARGHMGGKVRIDKNNFLPIYLRWLDEVKPIIDVDWERLKREMGILDSDFYLADLFVDDHDTVSVLDDTSVRDSLFVIYHRQGYKIAKESIGQMFDATIAIRNLERYQRFWRAYKRPPHKAYQEYIISRRDLLVPQDIRERKGAYFTPRIWVERSQEYLAKEFGESWQDEYYVWDCAAGTGNLLAGLSNKWRIFASTLDQADVLVMHERASQGANLLPSHIFQFDFLNDEFLPQSQGGKLPEKLYEIITDDTLRRKLIIYINPPYAEAGNKRQLAGTGENKGGTAKGNKTYERYKPLIKQAAGELFAQFLMRIYHEIPSCKLAEFSAMKGLQGPNFKAFRHSFRPKLKKCFIMPADTFDNVRGQFCIGFKIWNSEREEVFTYIQAEVFGKDGEPLPSKGIYPNDDARKIGEWLAKHKDPHSEGIGMMESGRNDFQHRDLIAIQHHIGDSSHALTLTLTNIQISAIFFAVRYCLPFTWLNNQDQFLYPNDGWREDAEFQSDCLAFTLFHDKNRITCKEGVNHWIPFTEKEVDAPEAFDSHWMTDYISGKLRPTARDTTPDLFDAEAPEVSPCPAEDAPPCGEAATCPTSLARPEPIAFSPEAEAVFDAGRALWRYYMRQPEAEANASYYDIRAHFQGFTERGGKRKMNTKSDDAEYTALVGALRGAVSRLGDKIAPKVYAYGFLRE